MEKVWLKSYPAWVKPEVNTQEYSSLLNLLLTSCENYKDCPAYECFGVKITYGQWQKQAEAFAAYLQHALGMVKGEKIALMMPNLLQYPIALMGAFMAGLVVVNVNPLYTARELRHQLKDSEATAIVIVENFAHVLKEVYSETKLKHIIVTKMGDCLGFLKGSIVNLVVKHVKKMVPNWEIPGAIFFKTSLSIGADLPHKKIDLDLKDIAFLQYTGGTTGVAKGAILTHGNMVANVCQAKAWIGHDVSLGKEVIITALPLYHIFSLTANCLTFACMGGLNVLITNPRDMPGFVKMLKKIDFTVITGVNTLFNGMLNNPDFKKLNFKNLKFTLGGGTAVQSSVATKWHEVTGVPLLEAYGLTETSPAVCINPLTLKKYNGSIGLPISNTNIKLLDENNNEVSFGEPGELCVYGPQVTIGYWQQPEETKKVFTADGGLRTGDIATIDEQGFVKIVDRKKDMILVSGFNVYPTEIEEVVASHKGVLEVAAVGVPSENAGEMVKIFVVKKDLTLTAEELLEYCRKNLTPYKVPKVVEFRNELPKTNVGKILRRMLKEE
ncbi:MAG: AMP-binding protein [Gammaproteobacteria bacterium]|nr:AMP-binding protein [Gammaproteobacteria bacterium]